MGHEEEICPPFASKYYAQKKGVLSDKWHLVTGSQDEIYHMGRHEYFVEEDLGLKKEKGEFLHTENFILVDHNRHIRGIYNGLNKASIQQLIEDIGSLKTELATQEFSESFAGYNIAPAAKKD